MNQPDLLEGIPQRFRNTDPDTSVEAANSIAGSISYRQGQVLNWLKGQPDGATDDELLAAFNSISSNYRTRRSELVEQGLVRDSTRRKVLLTGRKAIVWEVV